VYHEGGRSLGHDSAARFYYATRNHLLLAAGAGGRTRAAAAWRFCFVLAANVAHATVSPGDSVAARLAAAARGLRDYVAGRFGSGL
jgi:hypothetical protein